MNAKLLKEKRAKRLKRKLHIRKNISGTGNVPRISIFKSNKHFYAQAIDDDLGVTLASVNSIKVEKRSDELMKEIASSLSNALKGKGVDKAVFDRNGYKYHGLVQKFADSLREAGIKL